MILDGAGDELFDVSYTYKGRTVAYQHRFGGVVGHIEHTASTTTSATQRAWADAFTRMRPCTVCGGGRLKPESLSFRVGNTHTFEGDQSIADLVQMDLQSLVAWFDALESTGRQATIGEPIVKEIRERLGFLVGVGLEYLTLDRQARTLSGGESQRIRLATQIGTQLTGVLYVLDEPSIGLHPRDNAKLIAVAHGPARPGQLGARRRARPRDDRGGRLRGRHRPGRGRVRRRGPRRRTARDAPRRAAETARR